MIIDVGDLVKLKDNPYHGDLVGLVVKTGEEHRRMYGDGVEIRNYVDVVWFNKKYGYKPSRFTPGLTLLEMVSKAGMVESVYTEDLKSSAPEHVGSSPAPGTKNNT